MHGYRIPRFGIKFSYVSYKKRLPRKRLSLKVSYENKMQLYYHDVIITQWCHHGVKTSSWRYDVIMNLWGHHDLMTSSWLYEFMTSSWPYDIIWRYDKKYSLDPRCKVGDIWRGQLISPAQGRNRICPKLVKVARKANGDTWAAGARRRLYMI